MKKTVIELFAGVGGFRVGLNKIRSFNKNGRAVEKGEWDFVWANQWEPSTKEQHAFDCYALRFGKEDASNQDISLVDKATIPDHSLLTGGFPCQDYSVAHPKNNEKGIEGKKGVLWWQINDILLAKRPPFVLLENVDRLLKAPSAQRGQAFGIILRCFADAGYGVQWRVINAAEYGHAQKRRRTFIFAFHNSTNYYSQFEKSLENPVDAIVRKMMFSNPFPCEAQSELKQSNVSDEKQYPTVVEVSQKFAFAFENAGYCVDGQIFTAKVEPKTNKKAKTLRSLLDCDNVPEFCYKVSKEKIEYLKSSKRILRTAKNGHQYYFSEGQVPFPDKLDSPGRTMLTSEGTVNRSSHYILDPVSNKYRILTPIECERLDEFPDDWTNTGMPSKRRYFIAGNALVCGLVEAMGDEISDIINNE